jgi:hypothetical protein
MGFWDSVKSGAKTVGRVSGITPAYEIATKGELSDESKDFYTFGKNTRDRRAGEREQQAAQSAADTRQSLQSGYDTYRQSLASGQDAYNKSLGGLDTQSKESMDKYRIDRNRLDSQADNTRQTLMGMESNMLGEATKNVAGITDNYVGVSQRLSDEARQQATDARETYTGTVKPQLLNNLSDARNFQTTVAGQAMSLADSMDVNNKVAQGQRQLYGDLADKMTGRYQQASDQERADLEGLMGRGAGLFGSEIQSTRQRGLADAGVLSALGMQATNLLGGSQPMTGGQMAAIAGQQGAQASEAYASAQRRMRDLEDQRRSYQVSSLQTMGDRASELRRDSLSAEGALREGGLLAGREESNKAYDRGYLAQTEAMDRTANRLADLMGGEGDYNRMAADLRGEQSGYGRDIYGARGQQEQFRQNVADRLFGSQAAFEEGKINRGYGNTREDMGLRERAMGIDRDAAQRAFAGQQNLSSLDYNNMREQAGLQQSAITNQIQMQAARDQGNLATTMGALGMGTQLGAAYLGGPGMAAPMAANMAGQAAGGYQQGLATPQQRQQMFQPWSGYPVSNQMQPQYNLGLGY